MRQVLFMVVQLVVLYGLSAMLYRRLSRLLFYHLGDSATRVVWVITVVFWPGVLLHELSHLVVGRLLLVKTGGLTLVPKLQADGSVHMGSVLVPRTDIFRFFIIGVAPFGVGLAVIFTTLWLAEHYQLWQWWPWWLAVGLVLFEVANTMFLSPSDLRGAVYLAVFLAVVTGLLYWMGWRPDWAWVEPLVSANQGLLAQAVRWLWLPIFVDVAVVVGLWLYEDRLRRLV